MTINDMSHGEQRPEQTPAPLTESQIELYKWLHEQSRDRFKSRQGFEWKMAFGIWTGFGAAAGFLADKSIPCAVAGLGIAAVLIVAAVYGFRWVPEIRRRYQNDSNESKRYESKLLRHLGTRRAADDPSGIQDLDQNYHFGHRMWHYSSLTQAAITLAFLLVFVGVVIAGCRRGAPASVDHVAIDGHGGSEIKVTVTPPKLK